MQENETKHTVMSSADLALSNRDSKTKIKVNRSNRHDRILSTQNMDTNCLMNKSDVSGECKNQARETVELIKKLVEVVKQHESHSNSLLLAYECSDHLIEAYDVLIALQETSVPGEKKQENRNRRDTIENVAKHLISRLDIASNIAAKTTNGSVGDISSSFSPSSESSHQLPNYLSASSHIAWEESSVYSHTTG